MKTTENIIQVLFDKLTNSSLNSAITGDVYKRQRPVGSTLEDVVINCLPVNAEQLQTAIANVNVHVQDLIISENGAQARVPNHARLTALSALAVADLKENWTADLNYSIQQQAVIQDSDSESHYINIRIEFFIENL